MKFKIENGKIVPDRDMTKGEAQDKLTRMKGRQATLATKIGGSAGDAKTKLEAAKVRLDESIVNLETEIAKI